MEPIRGAAHQLADKTLAVVLAGGKGSRLGELTRWQAKPALPFGGHYRNIDFTLSNCVNSGLRHVAVLTQYRAHSLRQHLQQGWGWRPAASGGLQVWPARQRRGNGPYSGTADAVYQNLDRIDALGSDPVVVLAGDHIYKMDYRGMLDTHAASDADVTVGCVEVPLREASGFGIVTVDATGRIRRFDEKPEAPAALPQQPGMALASMGIYVFNRAVLVERLERDAADAGSRHDFGRNILPALVHDGRVLAYRFRDPQNGGRAYWRDVGTLDSYWQANLELLDEPPPLDLNDPAWPLRARRPHGPPPRFADAGTARRSIVAGGCTVAGRINQSLLSPNCDVGAGSYIEESVLLPNARVGRECRIRRAIVASDCVIPDGTVIGEDPVLDSEYYGLSDNHVTLVTAHALARAASGAAASAAKTRISRDHHAGRRLRGAGQPEASRGRRGVIVTWAAP